MKKLLPTLIACLSLIGCTSAKPGSTTQPSAPTAQQVLDNAVADEHFAFLIASAVLTGPDLTAAIDADAAFRADVPIVQAQINGQQLTPAQVLAALATNYAAVKQLSAKAATAPRPVPVPAPATKPVKLGPVGVPSEFVGDWHDPRYLASPTLAGIGLELVP